MNYLELVKKIMFYEQSHRESADTDEYDIVLTEETGLTVKFHCTSIIDWGDGSSVSGNTHTYSNYGAYTIKANGQIGGEEIGSFTDANDSFIVILKEARLVNSVLGDDCFSHQANLESVTFSGAETSIPSGAFYYCKSLTSINLPSGITSIGNSAFMASGITSLVIPSGVTSIGAQAFSGCESLSSITIPSGVERIEDYLFNYSYLLSIYLPSTINYIGNYAFKGVGEYGGDRHCDIYYNGSMAQWGNIEKANRWNSISPSSITVHCTDGDIYI